MMGGRGWGGIAKIDVNYIMSKEAQIELDAKIKAVQSNCITNKQF